MTERERDRIDDLNLKLDLFIGRCDTEFLKTDKLYSRVFEDNDKSSLCSQVRENKNDISDIKEMIGQMNTSMTATLETIKGMVPIKSKKLFSVGDKTVTTSQAWVFWNRFIIAILTALLTYFGVDFSLK